MLTFKIKNNNLIVRVRGELDLLIAKDFSQNIDKIILDNNIKHLILDLSKVTFIDSSGLGAILGRYKIIQQKGGRISIYGVIPSVYKILELSGILKIIPIIKENEMYFERKEA